MSEVKGLKIAVIGATGTIGRVVAQTLGNGGARLFLHGLRNREAMENLKASVASTDGVGFADLTLEGETISLFSQIATTWGGKLDGLVVCLGINPTAAPIRDLTLRDWQGTISVNLTAPFLCVKHAIPILRNSGRGSIVLLDSIFGVESPANRGAYGAAKHGLAGLVQTVSKEEGGSPGLRINAICPGPLWGPNVHQIFVKHAAETHTSIEDYVKQRIARIPAGRFAQEQDVANLARFLCSDESSYISGQLVRLTGGASE